MSTRKTFLFMPESAYGPTNNCIGIGNELLARGHRVVFSSDASWEGKLSALGFEEELVSMDPPSEEAAPVEDAASPDETAEEQDAGAFWKEYIQAMSPEFRKPTIEQIETVTKGIWEGGVAASQVAEEQLSAVVERVQPDVIVQDNFVMFPALYTGEAPFVRIVSCNPAEMPGERIPPVFSGLATDDPDSWNDYRAEYRRANEAVWQGFDSWVQEQGSPPLPDLEFLHSGDKLNLYVYPEELDYTDLRPLDATWHRIDSSVRETESPIELPAEFTSGDRPLVYFSLGSLGSADVPLMNRIIQVLGKLDIYVIVSKGPLHDEIELADNMFGQEFLPQTKLLPQADLVITHGGNNTVTEAMHFGKPMILLPLFWDQYDNAQRVHETGYGIRLSTYAFTDEEMAEAIEQLLGDADLRERLDAASARIQAADGVRKAAALLEELALTGDVSAE